MDFMQAILLALIGFGAGFVQRVSGFGLGIFAMMFLPHFLPTHTAAAVISTLWSCVTSTYNAVVYRKQVAYKTVIPMICAALVAIPIAVYFAAVVSANVFQILLGVILIILSAYFLLFSQKIHIRPTGINGAVAGGIGGALNGLFSTGGPPVVLFLSCATPDKLTYFATIQFYFAFTNLYATAMRAFNGLITGQILLWALVGVAGCMAGDYLGKLVFNKLDSQKVKYVIYIGMIISGIVMLVG